MKRSDYAPINDLLPQLRAAALKLRAQPNNANCDALDCLIRAVGDLWGFDLHDGQACKHWNVLIDTLDEQHPGWRGYIPGQRDERGAA